MNNEKFDRVLITSALPYANGPLHFGHLCGVYIPADIYRRHLERKKVKVIHISGSDEHGVAIMLNAQKSKQNYQEYVDHWHLEHKQLFSQYQIEFNFFGQTSKPYHKEEVVKWFKLLWDNGAIEIRGENQLYCIDDKMFLPDRYVEGTCYNCSFENARGDECPQCGTWIEATKLKNPRSKVSGSTNIEIRESQHYYLLLSKFEKEIKAFLKEKEQHWRKLVLGFVSGLIEKGMVDRAISRDLDWGINVPLPDAEGKKLYVWFDAPIGYVSNTKKYLEDTKSKEDYLKDWWANKNTKIVHFIGKDNIIFHALIWPIMAMGTGGRIQLPTEIPANEFVKLDGQQFSKSSGQAQNFDPIKAVDEFGIDALRVVLSSIIPETGDTSFSWDVFLSSTNDFGNKIGNFIHRAFSFMEKNWSEGLSSGAFESAFNHPHFKAITDSIIKINKELDDLQPANAYDSVLHLGQIANEYFHLEEPWKKIKESKEAAEVSLALSVVNILALGLVCEPFVPGFSEKLYKHFSSVSQDDLSELYINPEQAFRSIFKAGFKNSHTPEVLFPKIDPKRIEALKGEV